MGVQTFRDSSGEPTARFRGAVRADGLTPSGAALDAAHVTRGTRLLDAGCGSGLLALLATLRGAQVAALDASAALLESFASAPRQRTCERVPRGSAFADASFDAVTAVNSIFYAQDMKPPWRSSRASCVLLDAS